MIKVVVKYDDRIQEKFALSYRMVYYLACCKSVFEYLSSSNSFSTKKNSEKLRNTFLHLLSFRLPAAGDFETLPEAGLSAFLDLLLASGVLFASGVLPALTLGAETVEAVEAFA